MRPIASLITPSLKDGMTKLSTIGPNLRISSPDFALTACYYGA